MRKAIILFLLLLVTAVLAYIYRHELFAIVLVVANDLKEMHGWGMVILTLLIILTCIPPLFGYSTLITLSGFIYKFPLGFIPAYVGALCGGTCAFILGRRYKEPVKEWIMKYYANYFEATSAAVETGGLWMLILIRLAPYPFGLTSVMLSLTNISFVMYMKATAIALFKVAVHVFIGSTLESLANSGESSTEETILIIVSAILGILVFILLSYRINTILKRNAVRRQEEEVLIPS